MGKISWCIVVWFGFGRKIFNENGQILHQPDTPTSKRRSARLGGPEIGFMHFFGPHGRSNALPRRTTPPMRTCKLGFGSFFPLNLAIIHWTNEDPNK